MPNNDDIFYLFILFLSISVNNALYISHKCTRNKFSFIPIETLDKKRSISFIREIATKTSNNRKSAHHFFLRIPYCCSNGDHIWASKNYNQNYGTLGLDYLSVMRWTLRFSASIPFALFAINTISFFTNTFCK